MSKVCILGGTGFVGRHLAAKLVARSHSVKVLTRHRFLHTDMLVLPTFTLVQADVYDAGVLRDEFNGCDAVINLVGILNERGHKGHGFAEAHVTLTTAVLEACRGASIKRLLHMSALNAEIHGPSHYLRTKGTAEQLVYAAKHVDTTVFQPSVIFGSGDSFLTRFAGLLKRLPLFPLAFPKARFAPVYVGDVAEAYTCCIERREGIGRRYVLCGPRTYSLNELVRYAGQVSGPPPFRPGPAPPSGLAAGSDHGMVAGQAFFPGQLPFSHARQRERRGRPRDAADRGHASRSDRAAVSIGGAPRKIGI